MPWQNPHLSEQIKTVGITKVTYPTTPAIITNNQKTVITPGGALMQGEGETSRETTGTTGTELRKLWW